MALFSSTPVVSARIGNLVSSARAKIAPLTVNGKILTIGLAKTDAPLKCPYQYGSFDGAPTTRVNLCFEVGSELYGWVQSLERKVIEEATRRSKDLFGREMPLEEVARTFTTNLKEGSFQSFKVKMNLQGQRIVRCWDSDGKARALPDDVRTCSVLPLVEARSVWVQSGRFGIMWEAVDLRIEETQSKCPW